MRTSTKRSGAVYINKIEAARRQLDAAIRMTFANEDELAIHTVAAAAYRILRDILHNRGQHDLEELLRAGVHAYARELVDANFSNDVTERLEDLGLFDLILPIAQTLHEAGTPDSLDYMSLRIPDNWKIGHWRSMSQAAGYLKHADRNEEQLLSLGDIDNDTLMILACGSYAMATHRPTAEMIVFHIFWAASRGIREGLEPETAEIADWLSKRSPSRQRSACARFVRLSKKGQFSI
jgi:hypothetical protein